MNLLISRSDVRPWEGCSFRGSEVKAFAKMRTPGRWTSGEVQVRLNGSVLLELQSWKKMKIPLQLGETGELGGNEGILQLGETDKQLGRQPLTPTHW